MIGKTEIMKTSILHFFLKDTNMVMTIYISGFFFLADRDKIWISKNKRNILLPIFDKFGHALKNSFPDLDTFVVLGQVVLLVFLLF
jgi:hypothetical protein